MILKTEVRIFSHVNNTQTISKQMKLESVYAQEYKITSDMTDYIMRVGPCSAVTSSTATVVKVN